MGDPAPDRYGVMGFPVSHSRSPIIHRLFAQQTGQNLRYDLLEVAPENLESAVLDFQAQGGRGLNVTVPHKQAVMKFAHATSERASVAGAINTLIFADGHIYGDNTDGIGLRIDLSRNLGLNLKRANILILGAGGATRGIIAPLLEAEPRQVVIANRTVSRAQAIVDSFAASGKLSACRFDDVGSLPVYDLVINATSAGVRGETPPYPAAAISKQTICYDLSYGQTPTPFAQWAVANGAVKSVMGWGMLVEQAAASFHLWRKVKPDTAPVLRQLSVSA